jgi:hypothetical protein
VWQKTERGRLPPSSDKKTDCTQFKNQQFDRVSQVPNHVSHSIDANNHVAHQVHV